MQRLNSKRLLLVAALVSTASACGPRASESSVIKEAPNAQNDLTNLDLHGPFSWQDVQGPTEYSLDYTPWTDTYWPTYMKGLAYRFQASDPEGLAIFSLYDFMKEFFDTADSGDPVKFNLLSPAEKHDLVLGGNLQQFGALSRPQLLEHAKRLDEEMHAALNSLGVRPESELAEAKRAIIRKNISKISELMDSSTGGQLPLTTASWQQWADVAGYEGNRLHVVSDDDGFYVGGTDLIAPDARDWGWEGLCHGWAAAAVYAPEPKHSVMAIKPDGKKVLFTEGDIRGLLTKAWADNNASTKAFIGGRCNIKDDDIRTDRYGRSLDGTLSCKSNPDFPGCQGEQVLGLHISQEFVLGGLQVIEYRTWDSLDPARYLVRRSWQREGYLAHHFNSIGEIKEWLRANKPSKMQFFVRVQEQCRDVNPMTLHVILTKYMTQGHGFVMDRTRSAQVWNQPVKGYELEYIDIPGSSKPANEPTPIDEVRDAFWRYRSAGTKYLVQARVRLYWVGENGPYITYQGARSGRLYDIDDVSVNPLDLEYTLELDANKNLIGGEWGLIPNPNTSNTRRDTRNGPAPDFIYMYPAGSEPELPAGAGLDYNNVVKKLHACSLDESRELKLADLIDHTGRRVRYSECFLP